MEALAAEIGRPYSTYRFWESEPGRLKRSKHKEDVVSISKALGTNPLRIWYGDDEAEQQQGEAEAVNDPTEDGDIDKTVALIAFLGELRHRGDIPKDVQDRAKSLGIRLLT